MELNAKKEKAFNAVRRMQFERRIAFLLFVALAAVALVFHHYVTSHTQETHRPAGQTTSPEQRP